jgi:hypothetical protein
MRGSRSAATGRQRGADHARKREDFWFREDLFSEVNPCIAREVFAAALARKIYRPQGENPGARRVLERKSWCAPGFGATGASCSKPRAWGASTAAVTTLTGARCTKPRAWSGTANDAWLRVSLNLWNYMSSRGTKETVSAAERMRRYRQRRRNGLHCVRVLLHVTEIDALITKGFLKPERRHDPNAVDTALNGFICDALGDAA